MVCNKSGLQHVLGKVIVDATGDGDVAARHQHRSEVGSGFRPAGAADDDVLRNVGTSTSTSSSDYIDKNPDDFVDVEAALACAAAEGASTDGAASRRG